MSWMSRLAEGELGKLDELKDVLGKLDELIDEFGNCWMSLRMSWMSC